MIVSILFHGFLYGAIALAILVPFALFVMKAYVLVTVFLAFVRSTKRSR